MIAAPLSHGSNPNSNMAGRRREDDFNLVVNALTRNGVGAGGGPDDNAAQAGHLVAVAFATTDQDRARADGLTPPLRKNVNGQGTGSGPSIYASIGQSVRRLTPRECERLQGLPDDWTLIDWNGKPAPDSRRYAAVGDAVTVPVAEWLGRRLLHHLNEETA